MDTPGFDPQQYKQREQALWDEHAGLWHSAAPVLARWLGPLTETMLDLARVGPGSRVLDVAAGDGAQALLAARRVGPAGAVVATDLSEGILRLAAADAAQAGLTNVHTRVMDGEQPDVPAAWFDAAICRLGLMLLPHPGPALAAWRRVLKPGGRVAVLVWSLPANNGMITASSRIIQRRAQVPKPAPGQPGPFALAQPGALAGLLREAGYAGIEVLTFAVPLRLSTAAEATAFLRGTFPAFQRMLAALGEDERTAAWAEVEQAMGVFIGPDGFVGPAEFVVGAGSS